MVGVGVVMVGMVRIGGRWGEIDAVECVDGWTLRLVLTCEHLKILHDFWIVDTFVWLEAVVCVCVYVKEIECESYD